MKLQEIFTQKEYSAIEVDKIVYARDASEFEGKCQAVVWPTNKEQLVNMLKFGISGGVHFTLRGAAMNTLGACVPAQSVVVDMSRMNKILEWGSDFVVVESGVVLSDLLRSLEKKKLFFPVKPLEYPVCTIGGMLAMNSYGLDTYYGPIALWVEELEIIDGKGNRILVSGAQMKDFVGMEGSTGVIYSAKLKLLFEPKEKTVSIFKFNTLTAMMDKVLILDKNPNVLSIEYFDEYCSSFLQLGQALHLLVEYNNDSGLIKNSEEIVKIDEMKEKLQDILVNKKYTQKEDPKIPLEQITKFLHWTQKNGVPCFGHMKLRILHPCLREGSKLHSEMYPLIHSLGGEVAGQYGIGIKRKRFLSAEKKAKYKILKEKYDPDKILNRGVLLD
ncbi:MAG: FAD-binding oxidoreductase [bacterium]|nr:FAD-binding oxidoreductase [bacterium]